MRVAVVIAAAVVAAAQASAQPARDLSGHWDRSSGIESFANTPGGTRDNAQPGAREAPFTPAGRAAFDANKPGYGPRRAMARNDPMGRCEPLGLVRNLVTEIVAPHSTFELVQMPTRIVQFFEYRHDWREIWLDGRALPEGDDLYPKWNGFSVGRWQGDELVVESVGFDARTWLDKLGYPHSENMRVEERYRRVDGETLELVITVTDPEYYTEPWRSDVKRFRANAAKAKRWDEQIHCVPAEEMTYQDLVGTGNRID
ncbi:MAG TPA: hypothetical protein VM692_13850 [Gammaproteobacteria bacterium]|nr:hypothetical protein [Gammaproteobacteria bacterium]